MTERDDFPDESSDDPATNRSNGGSDELHDAPKAELDPKELDRIERLRDRTDEIELIISGLTTLALFTLPGILFDAFSLRYSHQSLGGSQVVEILLVLLPGLFYALGGCFAVHLMIRAYWAGLAGLRSVYPGGIIWKRVPGVGPMTREHYRERLPDLSRAIASADHAASGLFSVISMIALGMLWISALMLAILLAGQTLGGLFDDPDRVTDLSLATLLVLFFGAPGMLWLLDAVLGSRIPRLAERPLYRSIVRALIRINSWIWPQRLILPVQLTLQTNTRPYLFTLMTAVGAACIVVIGFVRYEAWTSFTLSDGFRYLDAAALENGIDSAHYEDLRGAPDRLKPVPTIDAFEQRGAFVRVFLPYYPLRDNPILDARCDGREPLGCLRGLWTVRLGDRRMNAGSLLPTERRDLNQRGLTGVLPLTGLAPGVHVLEVGLAAGPADDDAVVTFRIPFLFSPDQELSAADAPADPSRYDPWFSQPF